MNALFDKLNSAQLDAVKSTEGPVMAIAGAGSGKTRVLTRRMAHLIYNVGVPPHHVLAITFTNKAANEMKSRIAERLNIPTDTLWVSTFHSMCARILRTHIEKLGYERHFQIVDDDDSTQMVKMLLRDMNLDVKLVKPRTLKNHVQKIKAHPELLEDYKEPVRGYLEKIVPAYQRQLKRNNLVDFEDLLLLTIDLFKQHDEVRKYYHEQFQYVLVDEFQDTNDVQYELIRLLVGAHRNLFIVGDEDQSIYAFRGANIENIRRFTTDYPDAKRVLLEENYRSTNTILKAANDVISHNKSRIEKTLYSTKGEGEPIVWFKGYTYRDETEFVAETIRRLVHQGYRYEDIAVLYRANNTSRVFEETMMQKQIPYQVVGNTSFFKRKEIKDMVAYLRLILNPDDNYSFARIVNEPRRGIGQKTVDMLQAFAATEDASMFSRIDDAQTPLKKAATGKLKRFKELITDLRKALENVDFNTFMDTLVEKTGYKEMLQYDDMGDVRLENVMELKTMIAETQNAYRDNDKIDVLTQVLEDIALKSQEDERKDTNVVTLMTLHAAKGLEFRAVFIVALEQGMFPLARSFDSPAELEEERRLMYVGMTRAKEKLFFTSAQQRHLYGEPTSNPDSVFIHEIRDELIRVEGLNKAVTRSYTRPVRTAPPRDADHENDINKGDKINHSVFGRGVVVNVTQDQCVIAFNKDHGIKTLLKNHPSIKKV